MNKSKGEEGLYLLLREEYPNLFIACQYPIKVSKWTTLYIDFVILALKLAAEFDGIQHTKWTPFFGNKEQFKHSQQLDKEKELWCETNGLKLVRFNYKDKLTKQNLRKKISAIGEI